VLGLRRRILVRMAWRNAQRRPRQSVMIAAGLMVGTAIVAGAQVSGDSMGSGIEKATLDAFQLIDETVYLDGYNFFPQRVVDALSNDAQLRAATDGIGANIIWDAAVTDPRTSLYEPSVRWVGFDPGADKVWGPFKTHQGAFDGTELGPDDLVLNKEVAAQLDARVGDTVVVNYTLPEDPLVPELRNISGTIAVAANPGPLGLPGGPASAVPQEFRIGVGDSATRFNVILFWAPGGPARQDLDLEVVAPDGHTYRNTNGSVNAPDLPAFLFVNQSVAHPLAKGEWTVRVTAKAAVNTPFNGTAATFYAVYNLTQLEQRLARLQAQFPGFDPHDIAPPPRRTHSFRVAAISTGGKGPNFQLPNKLTMYGRLDGQQRLLGREGEVNFVKVSNPGGVEGGAKNTAKVYPVLWERLNATKTQFPGDESVQNLRANNDKQFWLDEAKRLGQLFSVFLTFVGSFSIIAGLLLIINIFTMLAEERKTELAMARAVGLRRGHLVQLFTFEGVLYALPAAVLGSFLGLGLAAVLIWGFNTFNPGGNLPPIPFRLRWDSLVFAFSVGILLTLGTVVLGARRVSRLNIVSAIRSLEDPPHLRGRRIILGAIVLLAIGLVGIYFAVADNSFSWQLFGPTSAALGLAMLARLVARKERVYPFAALTLFVYLTSTLFLIKQPTGREADVIRPVRAVVMTLSVVVMVVYTERLARALGGLFSRIKALRAVAIPAVSYPLHKKFRTGMTLAMFSVILLVVMLFSIFGALFAPDTERQAGGYDVEAVSGLSFDTLQGHGSDPHILDTVRYVDILPFFVRYGADIVTVNNRTTGQFGPPQNVIYGIDRSFAQHNQFHLVQRESRYPTDEAAYEAVVQDPNLVIVAYPYSTDSQGRDGVNHAGDYLQLSTKGDVKQLRIIGIQDQYHFPGLFLSRPVVDNLFSNTDRLVLLRLDDRSQDEVMAKRIEANYKDLGLDAASIRKKVLDQNQSFRQIFTLIRLFLSLGLIVGILSLGIVTARSVIERRQEIGMMRALGYLRRQIRRTFLMEMLTTVALGILIGTFIALIVSFAIWYAQLRQLRLPYVVPTGELLLIGFIAFTVTTLATLSPILRAARTPPAEALRYIE
jgi:putative ABC transport system permease protein